MRNHWWWRPGWRVGRRAYTFHITFDETTVDGAPRLHRLAADYQSRLAGMSGLDLVPLKWLHLTMQNVGFTDEVSGAEIQAVVRAARDHCVNLAPFDLSFDSLEMRSEAIALRPSPPEPVARLRSSLRSAIALVRGQIPEAPEHADGFEPHVSLAYSNADGPSDSFIERIAGVPGQRATVTVLAASLIILDRDERVYRWTTYETIPLGPPTKRTGALTSTRAGASGSTHPTAEQP